MTLLNIYKIENLNELKICYRLFKIKGLLSQSEDYDKNAQLLSDRVSRITRSPCILVKENEQLFIAQPIGYPDLPERVPVVGFELIIEPSTIEREIDCENLSEIDLKIVIRFLQFNLNGILFNNSNLWQPYAGGPFFQKNFDPSFRSHNATSYRGFKLRLILLPEHKVGLCVDITRKYASRYYMPERISPNEFRKYKRRKCIYEFGNRWYEIRIDGISGLNVTEERMDDNSSLFDYIHQNSKGPKSPSLLKLPLDCSVLTYKTRLGSIKRVPSALCRLTYKTDNPAVRSYHSRTIMPPQKRKEEIDFVVRKYLNRWVFQGVPIRLSQQMLHADCECLVPPALEFGGGKILSFNKTDEGIHTTLENFGRSKWTLLHSSDAGFFVKKNLDRQYLIMPKSMYDTFGRQYLNDLKYHFRKLFSPNGQIQYDPIVITYNDSVRQSIPTLGNEIIQSVTQSTSNIFWRAGFGLILIPRLNPKRRTREDELANLLMREFRKIGIHVSVAHTEIPSMNYVPVRLSNGNVDYRITDDERSAKKFRGYIRNVVLNKILLLNRCWPFVLSTPLNSDMIIGLDVKNSTVGLMLVFKDGRTFSFKTSQSRDKEKMSREHASSLIYQSLKKELDCESEGVNNITIHRDGKLYSEEMKGIMDAVERLKEEGLLNDNCNCNFVEIKKTSRVPLRFFDPLTHNGSMYERIEKPKMGTYKVFQNTAFLCTTGRPFRYQGTTKPLQVTKVGGKMHFKSILEDIFALANLTWTKPDYCSRLPISIKMIDIRLREVAGKYSEDKLKFIEEGEN